MPKDRVLARARDLVAMLAAKSPTAMKLMWDTWMCTNDLDYRRSIESVVMASSMIGGLR